MLKRIVGFLATAALAAAAPLATTSVGAAAATAAHSARQVAGADSRIEVGHFTRSNDTVTSTNWGGYAVQSASKFTDAKGTYVQPTATCTSSKDQYAAFWVGIDGYSSNSVEQLGTDSDCVGKNHPSYYAWYEMYPSASVELSTSKYPVKPGDTLTAEVSVSGSQFTLSLKSSEGWTFSTVQTGSGLAQSSAEWIAESPEICRFRCTLAQLADFGTMGFTNAEAAVGGGADEPISSFTYGGGPHEIVCVTSSGTVRDQPSVLGSGGNSFTITWKHD